MSTSHSRRRSALLKHSRKALSCTECARRKLKCSKTIPCTACLERGNAGICRRRNDTGSTPTSAEPPTQQIEHERAEFVNLADESIRSRSSQTTPNHDQPFREFQRFLPRSSGARNTDTPTRFGEPRPIDGVATDVPVALEFLALSRWRVLRLAAELDIPRTPDTGGVLVSADSILSLEQLDKLLKYHGENMLWTHNVVHLATFQLQCAEFLITQTVPDHPWLALYYAMLSMTMYHIKPDVLAKMDINNCDELVTRTYELSLATLHDADYTSNHSIFAVQAICLLIYVGHSMGQSDRICVLLASAIRIAQCLGLHRLGADNSSRFQDMQGENRLRAIVGREVQKRTWWFLIRQDWLQIPFANTYTVHPSQFNTPMPANCFDDRERMTRGGELEVQGADTYTHGSYTSILNHIATLVWKTQDRMCTAGHPRDAKNGLQALYNVVQEADRELNQIMRTMSIPFRVDKTIDVSQSNNMIQQLQSLRLTFAHKFYSIHRHFQVLSYRDHWFAYSRVSCVSKALDGLRNILELSDDEHTYIIRNLWTVSTQIVTAAIWIIFEVLFTQEGEGRLCSAEEGRTLLQKSVEFLRVVQDKSRIAQNGIQVLETLAAIEVDETTRSIDMEAVIERLSRDVVQSQSGRLTGFEALDPLIFEDWIYS